MQPNKKQPGVSNVFANSYQNTTQRTDRSYFKRLYQFNENELADFTLPFEQINVLAAAQKEGKGKGKVASGVINSTQLPPLDQRQADMEMEGSRQDSYQMYDMDGNLIREEDDVDYDQYGQEMNPSAMDGSQDQDPNADEDEDELRFEEFEEIVTRQEDTAKNKIAELRAANFIGKGTPIWYVQQEIKTGDQAISFFAKHGSNMPIKFINCNRKKLPLSQFRPYDLVTVENDKLLDSEYFTISAQGVVQIFQDKNQRGKRKQVTPTEFLSLPQWMQQSTMFNVLTSMKFFKHYLINKVFSQWKGNVRKRLFNRTRETLSKDLIIMRPDFVNEYISINSTLFEMQSRRTFEVEAKQQVPTLQEFATKQANHHEEVKMHYKTQVEDNIKNILVGLTKKVSDSRTLREEEDLDSSKKGKAEKKKSIVVQKEENRLKNQVLRLARRNFRSLGTFIRLIDYRVVEAQVSINQESAEYILSEMDKSQDQRKYSIQSIVDFNAKSLPSEETISFSPDKSAFKNTFDKLLTEMSAALQEILPINQQTDLQQFINNLNTDSSPRFQLIIEHCYKYQTTRRAIEDRLTKDFINIEEKTKTFEKCRDVFDFKQTFHFDDFKAAHRETRDIDSIKGWFEKLQNWEGDVSRNIKVQEQFGLIQVSGKGLRDQLTKKVKDEQQNFRNYLMELSNDYCTLCNRMLSEINSEVNKQTQGLSSYVYFMKSLSESKDKIKEIETKKNQLDSIKATLTKFRDRNENNFGTQNQVSGLQGRIDTIQTNLANAQKAVDEAQNKADMQKESNLEQLKKKIEDEKEKLDDLIEKAHSETLMNKDTPNNIALDELNKLQANYEKIYRKVEESRSFEKILNQPEAEIPQIDEYQKRFEKREKLWRSREDFKNKSRKWYMEEFLVQDAEAIVKEIGSYSRQNHEMKMKLQKDEKDDVLMAFSEEVAKVSDHNQLFLALGNRAMQKRHWNKIFFLLNELDGGNVGNTALDLQNVTFNKLIEDGCDKIREQIDEISGTAQGEKQIEDTMDEIVNKWDSTNFTVANYRDTKDRFIIKEVEEVITLLEDDIMQVSTMMGSKYVNEIKDKVQEWENKLGYISDVIDDWVNFQVKWMYLENIFNAEDIQQQLKAETKQFQQVDKFWKEHMNKIKKEPKVVNIYDSGVILKKFKENNKRLEDIQKGLEDFLGTKRAAFPRFYFLSNDELIEILSQTRNVHAVQPHLSKCFDNIKKIQFTEDKNSKEIVGMWSSELEYVPFSESVMAIGPVELWLSHIEGMMTQSLFDITKQAWKEYPEDVTNRDEWLFNYPAQPVLTIDMVMWTKGVTEAIMEIMSGVSDGALKEWQAIAEKQLQGMIRLVRGQLKPLQRAALGALIVLDVHAQHVVGIMIKNQVQNINDFNWTSQLRYYWEDIQDTDGDPYKGDEDNKDCFCKQTNTRFRYGYEYLGNGPRLVITPLTDQCYMTLTGALHSNYGGNPQGPAGTGKTETTKDLAKALAIQCVVFNCGDGLNASMMARFFTGLASGGAWSCFDEFNRIFIEVLSVIAQQILTIQSAVRARLPEFMFEGAIIPLNLRFGVFITMNPGYAGRTELPDNLKALFRPISMMIPDYQLIAQIFLYSEGFEAAAPLSQKMTKLYSLSSEQLSKQDHYDFGMRAVKSVLVMAGKLRRKDDTVPEDVLLIRAMRDSNVPKFLDHDLPLFQGIINDLFPGVEVPKVNQDLLEGAIKKQLRNDKFQCVDRFLEKIIQLLETMTVRHGNMIVGFSGVGKTTVSTVLGKALQSLYDEGHDDYWYQPVVIQTLNPKSVRMGELFGETNIYTAEWTEGIVSKLVQDAVKQAEGPKSHWKTWVNFDGPVDALWIENMNTVLDDNKMLCLNNGQRIRMPDTCTMMFEVNDLKVASPATVSRCGMVYLEPVHLGWQPLVETWSEKVSDVEISEKWVAQIKKAVIKYIAKLLPIVRSFKEAIESVDANLVASCLRLISIFLSKSAINLDKDDIDAERIINNYIIFCMTWSLGANIMENKDRISFKSHIESEISNYKTDFTSDLDIYGVYVNPETYKFEKWDELITEQFEFKPEQSFFDILVPTNDTVKYKFLQMKLLLAGHNVLITGETGVGKSVITKNFLMNAPETLLSAFLNFSGKTSTKNVVDALEDNLKAIKKDRLQPLAGKKMVFFVDDVNMPQLERYFAQPPCELLRQIIDQGGFYDTKNLFFKQVKETNFVAACAPPGGGRNAVTPRLFRHFNMIWVPELSSSSMRQIFSSILKGYLMLKPDGNLHAFSDQIIKAAVDIYGKTIKEFLPTPAKCHYTFNLRDLSKVVQGMLMCDYKKIEDKDYLIKLYICETFRVFRDRLIDEADRLKFTEECHEILVGPLGMEWQLEDYTNILFGDFDNPEQAYILLAPAEQIIPQLQNVLQGYNLSQPSQMNLIFFADCVAHLARIARILRQQRGNAMLVGVGGSGRSSMAKLAAYMNKMSTFQIEIAKNYKSREFHEDIKKLLMQCALEENEFGRSDVQFLFSDTQIVEESFLEDINNLLNSGEIPNLFATDEKVTICDELADKAKQAGVGGGREQIYPFFVSLCRERLHIVLAFSPVGNSFRDRCRQFPSIISCASIDWYNAWPEDALYSVAYSKYKQSQDELDISKELDVLAKASVHLHVTVREESENFYEELRRYNYVTPTSYLALVNVFLKELKNQRQLIPVAIQTYQNGLTCLASTNVIVNQLNDNLVLLKPKLAEEEESTQKMVVILQEKTLETKKTEAIVQKEEAEAKKIFNEAKEIQQGCDEVLAQAMPELNKAIAALDTLKEGDISEMKNYKDPPADLVMVLDAVALLKGLPAGFDNHKKMIAQPKKFIQELKSFDKNNMKEKTLTKLKKIIKNPNFTPANIQKKSVAGMSICMWVLAMDKYAEVNKIVVPKRAALEEANAKLKVVEKQLAEKQAQVSKIRAEKAALENDYAEKQQRLDNLSRQKQQIEIKLGRAEKLVNGLADESKRWEVAIEGLRDDEKNMLGNTVLAAGFLSYNACFTHKFRMNLQKRWMQYFRTLDLRFSADFSVQKMLGDPVKQRQWAIQGLPADNLSIDNGIIVTYPEARWPLIIDPQSQGNKWIKVKEKENNLRVIKLTNPKFLNITETAIKLGYSVLLENVGETLDPSLEPILSKNIQKKNGQPSIKLGDNWVTYHQDFLFFITTKLANPHYLPEICIKVTLINFTVTPSGLEDQLLVEVIKVEMPELEQQKDSNIVQLAEFNRQLKDLEKKILNLVSSAGEEILEDEELIEVLDQSKITSTNIGERKIEAEETMKRIDETRESYRPVAIRGSVLYFVIADLALVNSMYQYSLEFFTRLFKMRLEKSEPSDVLEKRLAILIEDVTRSFYLNICRGLFEVDKLLYSFLNTASILRREGAINNDEWNFLLRGSATDFRDKANQCSDLIDDKIWHGLHGLEECHSNFRGLCESFADTSDKPHWREIMKAEHPQTCSLPPIFEDKLSSFQKAMLFNVVRHTKLIGAIKEFVKTELGQMYIESPPFDLEGCLQDSSNITPIIFVLSPGADPIAYLKALAEAKDMSKKFESISLGQGQNVFAERLIEEGTKSGMWICLQNCHLYTSWMGELEKIQEKADATQIHPEYRLWLTSDPSPHFPVPVLQNGIKLTNEPPRGLKAGMTRTFTDLGTERYESINPKKKHQYKKLVFALAYFHSAILERRKYGAIGWNEAYQWMNSDFDISEKQLFMYLEEQNDVPYFTLNYLVSQVNYGGRVTDNKDVRLIIAMLKKFFCAEIMQDGYKMTSLDTYVAPPEGSLEDNLLHISKFPLEEDPEVFGLHSNANIAYDTAVVNSFVDTILLMQPRVGGGGSAKSPDAIVTDKAKEFLELLPPKLNTARAHPEVFKKMDNGAIISLGVFVDQEIARFNRLLGLVKSNLTDLIDAIKGTVVMSQLLEDMFNSFINSKVPDGWLNITVGYPSLKPLGSWVQDLCARIQFIGEWLYEGPPKSYWLSAFFFPQGFMTASMQSFARATLKPIDTLSFRTHVMPLYASEVKEAAEVGVQIHGLYMEGAKWDAAKKSIEDSDPKVTLVEFPVIWLEPDQIAEEDKPSPSESYACPLYKTSVRKGELNTTGHSTNFVLYLSLPSRVHQDYWIRRGAALLCMTDE